MAKRKRFTSKLIEAVKITETVKHFKFSIPEDFEYTPGQFMSVIIPHEDQVLGRAYSISTLPSVKNAVEFTIKLVDGGHGSNHLFNMKENDELKMIGPSGSFTMKDEHLNSDLVFIATGTGIAPFRSMIQHLLQNNFPNKIYLFAGVRYISEVLYPVEFTQLQQQHSNFNYFSIVSRPENDNYTGPKGHVQQLIESHLPSSFNGQVFICGLSPMINAVQNLLISKGIHANQIHFEKFDE